MSEIESLSTELIDHPVGHRYLNQGALLGRLNLSIPREGALWWFEGAKYICVGKERGRELEGLPGRQLAASEGSLVLP